MDRVFNVAVVGMGEQAWDNLLPSLAIIRNCRIAAVCDIDKQRTADAARSYGGNQYQDFYKMFNNEEKLDVVVVASYPQVHEEVLAYTLAQGIPTFVEKPPTATTQMLKILIDLNKKHRTQTAVGLNFNFTDAFQFIMNLADKQEFGYIQYLKINHYGSKPSEPIWGLESRVRSFLLAQAIHPLGILLNFGQPFGEVRVNSFSNDKGLFINTGVKLRNESGQFIDASVNTTSMAPFFQWDLELISSKGVIVTVNSLWDVKVYSKHRDNKIIDSQKWWHDSWHPSPLANGFKRTGYEHQFRYFFDCIANNKPNMTAIENLLPLYKLMDKVEEKVDAEEIKNAREQVYQP